MTAGAATTARTRVIGNFGRLWGRGYERLSPNLRRILSVSGSGATAYLQGLVTSDLKAPPTPPRPEPLGQPEPGIPKQFQSTPDLTEQDYGQVIFDETLRATCFLDAKGRIVTDSLLWKVSEDQYFIDVPTSAADMLLDHLKKYKLRRTKVVIEDKTDQMSSHVIFGTLNADEPPPPKGLVARVDPRHPSLGMRVLEDSAETAPGFDFSNTMKQTFTNMEGNYELVRRLAGVAEGSELTGHVALQANQEWLNAVSFDKGCYLGQELTARVQHTGAVRKRIVPLLLLDTKYEVPRQWKIVSDLQRGRYLKKYSKEQLRKLPTRQPRFSVSTAGHFVMLASGSMIDPDRVQGSVAEKEYKMAEELMDILQQHAVQGAKIVDTVDEQTIGKIVSPPVEGTNVVTALCRLDSLAIMGNNMWTHHNKVRIGDSDIIFRYLPFIPLWWPPVDAETGKAQEIDEEELDEADKENLWEVPEELEKMKDDEALVEKYKEQQQLDKSEKPTIGFMTSLGSFGKMPDPEEVSKKRKQEVETIKAGKPITPHTPKDNWFNHKRPETDESHDKNL
ncbi:hypothetical protein ACA910_000881 [Epithemia clementina (nom. ined.)]